MLFEPRHGPHGRQLWQPGGRSVKVSHHLKPVIWLWSKNNISVSLSSLLFQHICKGKVWIVNKLCTIYPNENHNKSVKKRFFGVNIAACHYEFESIVYRVIFPHRTLMLVQDYLPCVFLQILLVLWQLSSLLFPSVLLTLHFSKFVTRMYKIYSILWS